MKLIPSPPGKIVDGEIWLEGKDILKQTNKDMHTIRGNKISMIFQDPMTSLNPFLKISTQLMEVFMLHQGMNKQEAYDSSVDMLKAVGIPHPEKRIDDYPHQFSGGMRQRVMIAMALSCHPQVLIADEPTTALDVTIQAQILELIKELSVKRHTSTIFITHDLGVVAGTCHDLCVMYAGRIVEKAPNDDLFYDPKHPYTKGLLRSIPRRENKSEERLYSIMGQPPNLIDLPDCCPFFPRCEKAMDMCKEKLPQLKSLSENRAVRCWLYEDNQGDLP
jgi:oligopeptide transport system ATP-binding protein